MSDVLLVASVIFEAGWPFMIIPIMKMGFLYSDWKSLRKEALKAGGGFYDRALNLRSGLIKTCFWSLLLIGFTLYNTQALRYYAENSPEHPLAYGMFAAVFIGWVGIIRLNTTFSTIQRMMLRHKFQLSRFNIFKDVPFFLPGEE